MSERWIDKLTHGLEIPIPFDTFTFALGLYDQAARGTMPGYHLKGGPSPGDPPGGLYLRNIPMNRGMMAVVREMQHLSDEMRQALLMRLMHFGEALENAKSDQRFAEHFKDSEEEGAILVSDAFVRAVGECKFVVTDEKIGPCMDDLFRLASIYGESED